MNDLKKEVVGFTQITNKVIRDMNLSWKAKGIYSLIFSKPDGWQFSTRRIALESKDGVDSTLSGIQELEHAGYIKRERKNDGRVTYIVLINPHTENPYKPHTEIPSLGNSLIGKTRTVSNKDSIVIKSNSNKDIYSAEFESFWKDYPKKVGKGAAEKSWLKNNPPLDVVLSAIEIQKNTEQWSKENGQYIPHPATWLNGKRWEDEVEEDKIKTIIL